DLYAVARAENFFVVLAAAVHRLRRLVAPVPETADDVRPPHVTAFEDHQHFVIDVGDEPASALVAAHEGGQARPRFVAFACGVGGPGEVDLHPPLPLGIGDVFDDGGVDAVPASAEPIGYPAVEEGLDRREELQVH